MSSYRLECKKCHKRFDAWKLFDDESVKGYAEVTGTPIKEALKAKQEGLGCFCSECLKAFGDFAGDSIEKFYRELERRFIEEKNNADIS